MEIIDSVTERVTALTDLMMALAGIIAILQIRAMNHLAPWKTRLWIMIYTLFILAAVLGTIYHGLALPEVSLERMWATMFLSLGLMVALFVVAVFYDLFGQPVARRLLPVMILMGIAFFVMSISNGQDFSLFIMYEAGALVIALMGYTFLMIRKSPGSSLLVAGVLTTIVAAAVQATKAISLTPGIPFDHNSAYHLIQIAGIYLLVAGVKRSTTP